MEHEQQDIHHLIEIRGVYDGYSVIVLKDGTWVNRWAGRKGYERRAVMTQEYIDAHQKYEATHGGPKVDEVPC